MKFDLYFSVDIEADGPIPGEYSMLSLGAAVVGCYSGYAFEAQDWAFGKGDPDPLHTFYCEFKPMTDNYRKEALEVAGLDRAILLKKGTDPHHGMKKFQEWVNDVASKYHTHSNPPWKETVEFSPVFVAWPLSYDWLWVYWYLQYFNLESPFGFSGCADMKTMYWEQTGCVMRKATKRSMPKNIRSKRKHTHNALDDALEQGEIFANMLAGRSCE